MEQIDGPLEIFFLPPGQVQDYGLGSQFIFDLGNGPLEIRAYPVEFVDKSDSRYMVLVRLVPDGLRLGLHPAHGAENGHRPVQNTQGPLHFYGEIHVAGGVDNVDGLVQPMAGGHGRSDGDAPFLFFGHPIHDRLTVMDLPDFIGFAGIIEDALGQSGLAGIDVGHNADVSYLAQS